MGFQLGGQPVCACASVLCTHCQSGDQAKEWVRAPRGSQLAVVALKQDGAALHGAWVFPFSASWVSVWSVQVLIDFYFHISNNKRNWAGKIAREKEIEQRKPIQGQGYCEI